MDAFGSADKLKKIKIKEIYYLNGLINLLQNVIEKIMSNYNPIMIQY